MQLAFVQADAYFPLLPGPELYIFLFYFKLLTNMHWQGLLTSAGHFFSRNPRSERPDEFSKVYSLFDLFHRFFSHWLMMWPCTCVSHLPAVVDHVRTTTAQNIICVQC